MSEAQAGQGTGSGMTEAGGRLPDVSMRELVSVFGRIGLLSFGGPAGQIAMMHKVLVDERRWLDETRFLHALNFCMLLPGPEAMQLATYSGWLLRGVTGGLVAGLLFVLPGFLVIVALSWLYVVHGDVPAVDGALFGLKAAVLAIVLEALIRVSRRALTRRSAVVIAILAFFAIAFLKAPFPLIVAAAGLAGALLMATPQASMANAAPAIPAAASARQAWGESLRALAVWGAIWLVPLGALVLASSVFAPMAVFFSKVALVTFGGAYAVLAYVGQQAVEVHGWLGAEDMLAGLGLAETTPGPLILVLVFVGFLGGTVQNGWNGTTGGLAGAFVALFFTFVPCFLYIFAGAPHIERLRSNRRLAAALSAITAAVVGVIANLALWFSLHVLFTRMGATAFGPLTLPAPDPASFDKAAAAIAVVAGIALLRLHVPMLAVIAAAAIAGLVLRLAGF